jgi:TonB family protein
VSSARKVQGLTVAVSLVLHVGLTSGLSWLTHRGAERDAAREAAAAAPAVTLNPANTIAIELPAVGEGVLVEQAAAVPTGEPPHPSGGDVTPHLDDGKRGHGGDSSASAPALNLADRDERMRLSPDQLNRLDRDQLQRLRASQSRASWEDRRSTTHPTELTLVVTGMGTVLERRPASLWDPSRGALQSPSANVLGGEIGTTSTGEGPGKPGGAVLGSNEGAPGAGLLDGRPGVDHRASAPIGSARPDVAQAPVAVPASDPKRPTDDVDSNQEVATAVRSLVMASTPGGANGDGQGGTGGGGEAGAGGASGSGSHARPMGIGDGDVFDYWTSDPRLLPYFRQIHAKIDPLWADAFPKSALLDLKQGMVILEFTVMADGRAVVSWPPLRPSGIDEFDRNVADAVRRASPLPPIPASLGVHSLRIRAPFIVNNPVVK